MVQAKYAGYIQRQKEEIKRTTDRQNVIIPKHINYQDVPGLSHEVRQKLESTRPQTIGQAARIFGVTPAAISLLLVFLKKNKRNDKQSKKEAAKQK